MLSPSSSRAALQSLRARVIEALQNDAHVSSARLAHDQQGVFVRVYRNDVTQPRWTVCAGVRAFEVPIFNPNTPLCVCDVDVLQSSPSMTPNLLAHTDGLFYAPNVTINEIAAAHRVAVAAAYRAEHIAKP